MKTQRAELGTISHGTMRPEDLIPDFVSELERLAGADSAYAELIRDANAIEDFDSDGAADILDSLFDALNDFAPPYAYFGAHPGDGSDYGFWLSEDFQQMVRDNGGIEIEAGDEIPAEYAGEVLAITDHGNATLYYVEKPGAEPIEVWSVV